MLSARLLLVWLALLAPMLAAQDSVTTTVIQQASASAPEVPPEPTPEPPPEPPPEVVPAADTALNQAAPVLESMPKGDAGRGRLVFGACRTCHYPQAAMGHNNGPNLHRIFGKVAGKQEGFEYYSEVFKAAEFVWTPQVMYAWLENPMATFPGSTMMSLGVPDPQRRADLIAYLEQASVRDP